MSLLDRKLWRDIATLRGQVISIALVVAAGVAVFVASISTFNSLQSGRDRFYDGARFPQIFVILKRAPLSIVARLIDDSRSRNRRTAHRSRRHRRLARGPTAGFGARDFARPCWR